MRGGSLAGPARQCSIAPRLNCRRMPVAKAPARATVPFPPLPSPRETTCTGAPGPCGACPLLICGARPAALPPKAPKKRRGGRQGFQRVPEFQGAPAPLNLHFAKFCEISQNPKFSEIQATAKACRPPRSRSCPANHRGGAAWDVLGETRAHRSAPSTISRRSRYASPEIFPSRNLR